MRGQEEANRASHVAEIRHANAASTTQHHQPSSPGHGRTAQFLNSLEFPDAASQLPAFVRPLPAKIAPEDVQYLAVKGALTLPKITLQNALLRCYIEYVYPFMPLIDLHDFLSIVDRRDGINGQTSLLLYQSIMFSAVAFVDIKHLREAGFSSRKAARKAFFQKTRVSSAYVFEQEELLKKKKERKKKCLNTLYSCSMILITNKIDWYSSSLSCR